MFPGVIGMTVLFTAVFSAISIIWDREFGFLKEILVSPVPRPAIALGKIFGGASVATIQGLIILALAPVVGVHLSLHSFPPTIGMILLGACALTAFGLMVASRMESMQGFQIIMNFLLLPMFFLSGAIFPLKGTPSWMQTLAIVDPLTYAVDGLRAAMGVGHSLYPLWFSSLILGVVTLLLALLAVGAFSSSR
jgi:ABC-2 type transport system permease protein